MALSKQCGARCITCIQNDKPRWSTGFGRYLSLGNVRVLLRVKFVLNGILWEHNEVSRVGIRNRLTVFTENITVQGE